MMPPKAADDNKQSNKSLFEVEHAAATQQAHVFILLHRAGMGTVTSLTSMFPTASEHDAKMSSLACEVCRGEIDAADATSGKNILENMPACIIRCV